MFIISIIMLLLLLCMESNIVILYSGSCRDLSGWFKNSAKVGYLGMSEYLNYYQ